MEAGRQAVPAAAGAARRGDRRPRRRRRAHLGVRGRADPPRLAVPRRRDGRGRPAPRGRVGQRPLGQPRRDPHRRLPVLEVLRADRRPRRRTPYASRRRPSPGSSRARSSRRSARTDGQDPLEHYLRVVAGKTGSLIATSARYGAMFAGAPRDVEEALTEYGEKVGVAFQLSDDILDVASETEESGKTPGHRPARGRADAAGADRAALHRPGRRAPAGAARLRPHRRRPARRGPRPAAGPPGDGRGPRLRRRARRARPRTLLKVLPEGRSGRRSRRFADAVATRTT